MNYKRILKTGVLAVVATIAFALFAYRAAEWSKGLNSEFIVLGQSGGPGGGTGGGTGTIAATTKIIPQVAVGSFDAGTKYATIIQIVNTGTAAIAVTGNFYKQDGSTSSLTFSTNLAATPTFTGTLTSASLAAGQVLVISGGTTTTNTPATGSLAWAKITTTGNVAITTFFELRATGTDGLYSRVGVAASPMDLSKFVIPRVREVAVGLDVGFALVNTGSAAATLTATLKDANGTTIATKVLPMAAGKHEVAFANEFFALTSESSARQYHYINFESSSASFAAIAVAFEGGTQTSFPVERLQ